MLVTESKLRQIVREEYENLQKEAGTQVGRSGMKYGRVKHAYQLDDPKRSRSDSAVNTKYQIFHSIFSGKTEQDMEAMPQLKDMAIRLYADYVGDKKQNKEAVDKYLQDHGLGFILKYI